MPTKPANKPGSERYRDERRNDDKPKMHGQQWHEHETKEFEPEAMAGADAVLEVEGSGEQTGMGRVRPNAKTSQGRVRRKRTTPVSKGPKKKTREAGGSRRGAKTTNRAGNPG